MKKIELKKVFFTLLVARYSMLEYSFQFLVFALYLKWYYSFLIWILLVFTIAIIEKKLTRLYQKKYNRVEVIVPKKS